VYFNGYILFILNLVEKVFEQALKLNGTPGTHADPKCGGPDKMRAMGQA
jgi:hypothetical protein